MFKKIALLCNRSKLLLIPKFVSNVVHEGQRRRKVGSLLGCLYLSRIMLKLINWYKRFVQIVFMFNFVLFQLYQR